MKQYNKLIFLLLTVIMLLTICSCANKLELEGVQKSPIGVGCTVAASDGRKAIGRT